MDNPEQDMQTWIDILRSDKEMLEGKNSELVDRLFQERKEAEKRNMKFEKVNCKFIVFLIQLEVIPVFY